MARERQTDEAWAWLTAQLEGALNGRPFSRSQLLEFLRARVTGNRELTRAWRHHR